LFFSNAAPLLAYGGALSCWIAGFWHDPETWLLK